jgi:CheY-like chemotaxis protein
VERIQRARGDRDPEALLAREQALRQQADAARASLRAIFESVPGSYLVLAPDDDYRIVGVTEAYLRSTMTERAAIVDQPLFDVFPEDPNEPETDGRPAAVASLARVRRTLKADVMGVHRFPIRRPAERGGGYEERYWGSINAPVRGPTGELAYITHRVARTVRRCASTNARWPRRSAQEMVGQMVTLRKAAIDARTVVERAIETVKPLMDEQRHRLQASVPDAPLTVEGDMIRLEQLVANLLTNAAKFTKPGGLVRVEVEKRGDDIRISVRDNGTGISRELLPHVFDLFSQSERSADRSAGGLGIGLTLVKAIAEMHGGSAEARSAGTGRGSEFIVRLPALSRAAIEEPVPPELEAGEDSVTAQRVLVVDDNEDAAMGLARLLEFSGHEVRQAHTGPAALEEAPAFKPDAILLDIGLPDLDGYEVAKRLRQDAELRDVTLIAISGYCQPADRRRSREAGFDHHLAKPTDHRRLLKLLERTGTRDGREDGGRRNGNAPR